MPNGASVGALHPAGPGPVPRGLAAPGMPPPTVQGNHPYYVIHARGKPIHYSLIFVVTQPLLLRQ
jgi:hypothetical protein